MRWPIIVLLITVGSTGWAAERQDVKELLEYNRHDLRVTSLCIEGHIVVVAHSDVGKGGGLQMMQLHHEVNGKIVPIRCSASQTPESQQTPNSDPGSK